MLNYLDEAGLARDTLVIYTSDQGMFLGEHSLYDKRWIFEESLRMPFLARLPGKIPPGSVNDDIITNVDFAETFLDYAGLDIPQAMQGRSFRANLEGRTPSDWRKAMYYRYWMQVEGSNVPAHYGIRTKRHKLIFYYGLPLGRKGTTATWITKPGWELYDLQEDPKELNNVYDEPQYAPTVTRLKQDLLKLKTDLDDQDEAYPELVTLRKEH